MRKSICLFLVAGIALPVLGQGQLDIITLKHRSADQVMPALQPLVESGGAISGVNNRIMVRASAANRAEIKRALAALDTPLRRLLISVKQENDRSSATSGAAVSGDIAVGGDARVTLPGARAGRGLTIKSRRGDSAIGARVYGTRGSASGRVMQQVQVVEGGKALIQAGTSLPIRLYQTAIGLRGAGVSESVVYRDIGTGFYAQPNVSGDTVTLEISPQQESFSATERGAIESQRLSTKVSGRLGEWIQLGGTSGDTTTVQGATATYSTRGSLEQRRVLLKVEELP